MIFELHPEAELELLESAAYYDAQSPGLGNDFVTEIFRAIDFVRDHPEGAPMVGEGRRRKLVARFPFGIIYSVRSDRLRILAVMNLHRRPRYWSSRR